MRVVFTALFFIYNLSAIGQINSIADGPWEDPATWDCSCVPDNNSSGPITVSNVVTINADITLNEVIISNGGVVTNNGFTVTIEDDFVFTPLLIESGGTLINNGILDLESLLFFTPCLVDGVLESSSTILLSDFSLLNFNNGSTYRHNYSSGGAVPIALWADNSTCEITGLTAADPSAPSNLNQTFGNFTWNTPLMGATTTFSLGGQLTSLNGDLTFVSTGSPVRVVRFANGTSGYNLSVGGDFNVLGGTIFLTQSLSSATTISVGDFLQSGGNLSLGNSNTNSITLEINGSFSKTSGSLVSGSGTGARNIVFNGNGSDQTYFANTLTSAFNFSVASGAVLNLGTSALITSGTAGSFTLNTGATVKVGSLNSSGAIQGNIPMTSRTFNSGSTIIYNGSGGQFMGSAQPSGSGVSTIIDNASGVSLATSVTLGGNLTLTNGNLSIGNNTLTLGGTLTPNSNSLVATTSSNISITGAGPFGTLPLSGSTTINNFSINRTPGGSVTLGSDMTIDGTFTQDAGTLILNGNDLTVSGNYVSANGDITSNSSSSLIIEDNGTLPTSLNISGGAMGTFTLNRPSSTLAIPATYTVTNLNLLQGTYNNTGGSTTMASGGTITRSVGSMTQEPGAVTSYNVIYSGTTNLTTGVELSPSVTTALNNLTNSNSGIVTLNNNITINGDLTLSSGSFDASSRTIVLRGDLTSNAGATLTSSPFFFDGTTVISGTTIPTFGDITVNDLAAVTLPSSILSVTGDFLIDPGSTITHGGGTVQFSGSVDQTLGGGGKSLNNITVNKTGGGMFLQSQVNLIGILSIQTATALSSDGNLVLVSTSDAATGNASIATLASGASITGNVTVQRFMSEEGRIYRYISSPVASLPVTDLQDDFPITGTFTGASTCSGCLTNPSMYYWDETITGDITAGYIAFPVSSNSETLTVGRGYPAFIRDNIIPGPVTIDMTGTVNQGPISVPVTFTSTPDANADGWNLVGNPYPSTIDWDNVTPPERPNVSGVIAVRDNGAGGVYQYYPSGGGGGLVSGRIAAGQGFWVRATANSSISLGEDDKTNTTGAFYREDQKEDANVLTIVLAKDGVVDRAYLWFREDSHPELDDNDAPKLNNETFDISTVTAGGISMAVNSTNEMVCDVVNVKIKDMPIGSYTMSVESIGAFANFNAIVVDNFTNTQHDFSQSPEYQFSVTSNAASSAANRFSILLDQPEINTAVTSAVSPELCLTNSYKVNLDNPQSGVYYFAEMNGEVLGDSILSNGVDPVVLSIDSAKLALGSNTVVIKGYNYCETLPMNNTINVNHDIVYSATASSETQCLEGTVDLEAQGAPENGFYNWYDAENSTTPIEGQHSSLFTTTSLSKSSTYYVAAVNSNGCEGPRTPVVAEVLQFEPVTISELNPGELTSSYSEGNQWYKDGIIIDGATDNVFVPQESGLYRVEVALSGGKCSTAAERNFVVTGVESSNPNSGINIYPNPVVDETLYVKVQTGTKVGPISIFNNLGVKIGDIKLVEKEGGMEGTFDMRNSSSGVYFVKTQLNKRAVTLKVIKR